MSVEEAVAFHTRAIEHHQKEIFNIIHRAAQVAICESCGDTFDPDDNVYGYCSEKCANYE